MFSSIVFVTSVIVLVMLTCLSKPTGSYALLLWMKTVWSVYPSLCLSVNTLPQYQGNHFNFLHMFTLKRPFKQSCV